MTSSKSWSLSALPWSNLFGVEGLPSWTSPFELGASFGICVTTYSWSESSWARDVVSQSWDLLRLWKKTNQRWKETCFHCQRMAKNVPAGSLATGPVPFAVFVCAYAALHDMSSYAMMYSHKPHCAYMCEQTLPRQAQAVTTATMHDVGIPLVDLGLVVLPTALYLQRYLVSFVRGTCVLRIFCSISQTRKWFPSLWSLKSKSPVISTWLSKELALPGLSIDFSVARGELPPPR